MNTSPPEHPRREQLVDYGLGKVPEPDSSRIGEHIEQCADCQLTLSDMRDDTFVALVRGVCPEEQVASDSAPLGSISPDVTVAPDSTAGESVGGHSDLPPELRDHPRYEILDLIGRGGMGDVYRAQHKVMNRVVALKLIKPELVRNDAAVQRFRREVQAAARLHHANIVTAFDAEQAGDVHFLVMEYVDGVDLDQFVRRGGAMPVEQACECIRQAAEGLQYAHEKGMVHRDIKPHNLMVTRSGEVKILDFGLANFASEAAAEEADGLATANEEESQPIPPQLTQTGSMMGTPDFISPEQALDAHTADIRADIYSLGCTFYKLLTGKAPFDEGSVIDKIDAHKKQRARPISEFRADVPPKVQSIVGKMMAKLANGRYQEPREVAEALVPYAQAGAVPAPIVQTQASAARSIPLVPVAIAAMLFFAIVAGIVFYVQTNVGTIRVDVADESLSVSVDGKQITMRDGDTPITIRPGEKSLVVRRADFEFETDTFQLRRGEEIAISVRLLDGEVVVMNDGRRFDAKRLPSKGHDPWVIAGGAVIDLGDQRQDVLAAASKFFSFRDNGDLDAMYELCSDHAKQIGREKLTGGFQAARDGFGAPRNRQLTIARFVKQPSNMPSGKYVGLEMQTEFEKHPRAWENLLLVQDASGGWKVELYATLLSRIEMPVDQDPHADDEIALVRAMGGHGGKVEAISVSLQGRMLSVDQSGNMCGWDLEPLKSAGTLRPFPGAIWAARFTPSGDRFVTVHEDRRLRVWKTGSNQPEVEVDLGAIEGSEEITPRGVAVSSDGKQAAVVGHRSKNILIVDIDSGDVTQRIPSGGGLSIYYLDQDRKLVAVSNRKVRLLSVADGSNVWEVEVPNYGIELSVSPDEKFIAVGSRNGRLVILNASDGTEHIELTGHRATVNCLEFTSDSRHLVTGSDDTTIRLWDVATGEEVARGQGPSHCFNRLAVLPDGQRVVTGGGGYYNDAAKKYSTDPDRNLYLWRLPVVALPIEPPRELTLETRLEGHTGIGVSTSSLATTFDGKRLVSAGGKDKTARLWNAETSELLFTMPMEDDAPASVAITPDGTLAAVRGTRGMIDVWDLTQRERLRQLDQTEVRGAGIAFTSDGKRLVTGALPAGEKYKPVSIVWDVETGERLHQHRFPFDEPVGAIVPVPNTSDVIFTAKSFWRWNTDTGHLAPLPGWPESLGGDISLSADGTLAVLTINETISLEPIRKRLGVEVRNLATGEVVRELASAEFRAGNSIPKMPVSLCFLSGNSHVALGFTGGSVEVHDIDTGHMVARKVGMGMMPQLVALANGRLAVFSANTVDTPPELVVLRIPSGESESTHSPATTPRGNAARTAAVAWLDLADKGDYAKCYGEMADRFKKDVGDVTFVEMIATLRDKLGKVESRELKGFNVKSLGRMKLIEFFFSTRFASSDATETLVVIQDNDGDWRIFNYTASEKR